MDLGTRTAHAGGATRMSPPPMQFPPGSLKSFAPSDHELTVVVPAFNEELRLPATLDGLKSYLDNWGVDYRVLVANDGSRDRTADISAGFGPRFSTLTLERQSGKGGAVRRGMLAATGRCVAFTDADLPYDLDSLRQGYQRIRDRQCEACFGARDLNGSEYKAQRKRLRKIATAVFRGVVRVLVSNSITDTQCGLKVFSRRAAVELFSRTTINGFAFDAEVVYLTHRLGIPYQRIPVVLINEYSSTLSLSRHALPMLMDVLRVHRNAWQGKYDLQAIRYPSDLAAADADADAVRIPDAASTERRAA
jgi:dolichyl-phosphate beta-glucosyltransferase